MDKNTELILAQSASPANWGDEEKATNDLDLLREEFRKRLYSERGARLISQERNGEGAKAEQ